MKSSWYKPLVFFILTCSFFTCIDPYNLKPGRFQSLFVVDARLTDYAQSPCSGFVFVEIAYVGGRVLSKLAFSATECSDCTLQGGLIKPNFWIDL